MEVPQIKDREGLEAWLKTRSREECIAIAHRAAMRVAVPYIIEFYKSDLELKERQLLTNLRLLLANGVAAIQHREDIRYLDFAIAAATKSNVIMSSANVINTKPFQWVSQCAMVLDGAALDASQFANELARTPGGPAGEQASLAHRYAYENDIDAVTSGATLPSRALWMGSKFYYETEWRIGQKLLNSLGTIGEFWVRWYNAALFGEPLDWKIQEEIARLDWKVWEGDVSALAEKIAAIELRFKKRRKKAKTSVAVGPVDEVNEFLDATSAGKPRGIAAVKAAVNLHHSDLPPTFAAVLEFISLEVARLQGKNYQTDDERDEYLRQIRVLCVLDAAICAMKESIPTNRDISDSEAEKVEKLSRLVVRKFKEWPRANVDDVVDSTCRFALIGTVTCLAPLIGVPALYGFIGGGVVFGGKKIADAVKLALDSKGLTLPPS